VKIKLSNIYNIFLLFLPFTQALTLNIFFALKISEIVLFFLIFMFLQCKFSKQYVETLKKIRIVPVFLIWFTVSFFINTFWEYTYSLKIVPFRIGMISDSLLRLIYIYINASALIISIYFLSKKIRLLNFWLIGAVLAAIYSWYIFISSAIGIPYLRLFGMEEIPQNIMGIVRAGTFKEGNFFSLFLILSGAIGFYLNRTRTAWFLIFTVLTTLSTIGVVSSLLFLLLYFRRKILVVRNLKIFMLATPVLILFSIFFFRSQFYEKYIYGKIFTPIENLTPSNLSKVDRYLTSDIAFKQGLDNPFFGVGPNNFTLHYDEYNNIENIVQNNTEWSLAYFEREGKRAIPNNVYLEVWAEYGIVGFTLFILFLIYTLWISYKTRNLAITSGLFAMYLSFIAFPSFIMLFIWVYLAIPYALYTRQKIKNAEIKTA
jgi:O-antigen ligase